MTGEKFSIEVLMIDELKQLLDLVRELPELAVWSLLGFATYKLVVYLSTTGSIVFVLKLLIEKCHSAITSPKEVAHVWRIGDWCLMSDAKDSLESAVTGALRECRPEKSTRYIHGSDVGPLIEHLREFKRKASDD